MREQRNLSQRAVAEAAGVSAAALSRIEAGQISPSVVTLEKLADGMGVSVAAFFLDTGERSDMKWKYFRLRVAQAYPYIAAVT